MAVCTDCNLEMTTADGCTLAQVPIAGVLRPRLRCADRRCGDCGATARAFHHLGCDLERCPNCGGQLISCGCWNDGVDDEYDDDGM